MKRYKQIFIAFLLLFSMATVVVGSSGCYYSKQCQATKVGNHKGR
jgi:hypothetical protein